MSSLSLEQMNDLLAKLNRLGAINDEQERASTAHREASSRWNRARSEYAQVHAEIVAQYGEENAPFWVESLRGPRARVAPAQGENHG
ncbi:hypothetical protein [Variovorax sp.]|jgi:hypothetical protein|uniref:hypothetical protein n=1 Tax=Variovorax sp. TaxID=1871043 RepID=UPI004038281C